jgi:hypothetical protein
MKNLPIISGIVTLVLAPVAPLLAIEGEPDEARPPQAAQPAEAAPNAEAAPADNNEAAPAAKAEVPYLGVVSNPVTPTLARRPR